MSKILKCVTVKQIQELDKIAIEQYGIPSIVLMENAGRAVAVEILSRLKGQHSKQVSIFCGIGNNAGDGFVVGRYLMNANIPVQIFLIGQPAQLKKDAYLNYQIFRKIGGSIYTITKINHFVKNKIQQSSLCVDAIFGVGLNRYIQEPFYTIIDYLNHSKKFIIAVDIPSGLNGTTGKIFGICVKAKLTVTFSLPKRGFYLHRASQYTGNVQVVDIGIPKSLMKRI